MNKIFKIKLNKILGIFGYRLEKCSRSTLISQEVLTGIKSVLIEQLVNFQYPKIDDHIHNSISSKVIDSYNQACLSDHDHVFNASDCWNHVYVDSTYLINDEKMKSNLVESLFYGWRTQWLEGRNSAAQAISLLSNAETLERFIHSAIRGRVFLIKQSQVNDLDVKIIQKVFQPGQPLIFSWEDQIISDCDPYWFYLTRIKKFLSLEKNEHCVFLDIGSGNGRLGWVFKQLFPNSTVIFADLPSTLLTASYRIGMSFPELKHFYYNQNLVGEDLIDLQKFDFIFLPGFALKFLPKGFVDIVVNTASFSEMRFETIEKYISITESLLKDNGILYSVNRSVNKLNRGMHYDIPFSEFPISKISFEKIHYDEIFDDINEFNLGSSLHCAEGVFKKR